jgi:hypothetical protein
MLLWLYLFIFLWRKKCEMWRLLWVMCCNEMIIMIFLFPFLKELEFFMREIDECLIMHVHLIDLWVLLMMMWCLFLQYWQFYIIFPHGIMLTWKYCTVIIEYELLFPSHYQVCLHFPLALLITRQSGLEINEVPRIFYWTLIMNCVLKEVVIPIMAINISLFCEKHTFLERRTICHIPSSDS